jgi:glycosyltransferase involved in cell wall biosynthesis
VFGRDKPEVNSASKPPIVGWIGSPQTSRYLQPLLPLFESIKKEMPVRFVAMGARAEDFAGTPVEVWPWSEGADVESLQRFDIGIMPLQDSPWKRGKYGYKLIQYMACGIPVVASPVGTNREIVVSDKNGLFADSAGDWDKALRTLLNVDSDVRKRMGGAGRARVVERYSVQSQASRFLNELYEAVR